ncbi:MAG: hypothetical protein Q7U51_16095, partial [Methanoregula sp.]|nr:hypothetical protein [Methanoregula sp.]
MTQNFCPNCGEALAFSNAEFCPKCKTFIIEYSIEEPSFCSICGKHIDYDYPETWFDPFALIDHVSPSHCQNCGVPIRKKPAFSLKDFLNKNSKLFVILGVFFALSVYLTEFSKKSITENNINFNVGTSTFFLNLSIGSCLLISVFILIIIMLDLFDISFYKYRAKTIYKIISFFSINRIFFAAPLILLFAGLFAYTFFSYSDPLNFIGC